MSQLLTPSALIALLTFLLGLSVAVMYTRVQAKSARRSADAARGRWWR